MGQAPIRLATRGSKLALAQACGVAREITDRLGRRVEIQTVSTSGDRLAEVALAAVGGKGLFVKEIQEAVLRGEADVALHSAKDLPAQGPAALCLAAIPRRGDPRDALVTRSRRARWHQLAPGARVGTGSRRRAMWLHNRLPGLDVALLRGNVTTRLQRLDAGDFDALILACAGLDRLDLANRIDERVAPELLLPAGGQGTLALEARSDSSVVDELGALNDEATRRTLRAERAFLRQLEGDCDLPVSAFAEVTPGGGGGIRLRGAVGQPDGTRIECVESTGEDATEVGESAARTLLTRCGEAFFAALRATPRGG